MYATQKKWHHKASSGKKYIFIRSLNYTYQKKKVTKQVSCLILLEHKSLDDFTATLLSPHSPLHWDVATSNPLRQLTLGINPSRCSSPLLPGWHIACESCMRWDGNTEIAESGRNMRHERFLLRLASSCELSCLVFVRKKCFCHCCWASCNRTGLSAEQILALMSFSAFQLRILPKVEVCQRCIHVQTRKEFCAVVQHFSGVLTRCDGSSQPRTSPVCGRVVSQTRGEACGPLNHPRSLNRVLIFKGGSAAWHNALCLGNYFFSACVAFCSGHGWVALGGDRWRPLASLTHVERLWWVSDEGRAGCRGPALCLCDVLMWAGRIGDLKASLRLSAGATRTCSYNVIWLNIARSVFASSKSPSTQHE